MTEVGDHLLLHCPYNADDVMNEFKPNDHTVCVPISHNSSWKCRELEPSQKKLLANSIMRFRGSLQKTWNKMEAFAKSE